MEKLTLNVEELRVQSFVTEDADEQKGTVLGQEGAAPSRFISRCCQTDEFQSCPVRCTP
ncbi:MAG TPA: pinensin family lanthipeptide [Longimicrobium sp.]|nr:pinensin family lanthipeptide [Longimicrobium sp.]